MQKCIVFGKNYVKSISEWKFLCYKEEFAYWNNAQIKGKLSVNCKMSVKMSLIFAKISDCVFSSLLQIIVLINEKLTHYLNISVQLLLKPAFGNFQLWQLWDENSRCFENQFYEVNLKLVTVTELPVLGISIVKLFK